MIEAKETLTGGITSRQTLSGSTNVSEIKIQPELEDLTITPTKEQAVYTHENSDGYDKVTVNPIPEEYITPDGTLEISENGEVDVTTYKKANVNVTFTPTLQNKNITITENGTQNITADSGYDGLGEVNVTVEVEGSGGDSESVEPITKISDIEEEIKCLNDTVSKRLTETVNNYPSYTNNSVTLYTPNETNKYYVIRKRGVRQYAIIWFPELIIKQDTVGLLATTKIEASSYLNYNGEPEITSLTNRSKNALGYCSSNYTTFEECVEAIQNPSTTYTTAENSAWGVQLQNDSWDGYEEYHLQATNLPYININGEFNNTRRISSNETIEVIG